ncbi:MAG: hypothetical protein N2A40_03130, partial [Desulfobulbaceae bacterium]
SVREFFADVSKIKGGNIMTRALCSAEIGIVKNLRAANMVKVRGIGHGHIVFYAGNFVNIKLFQIVAIAEEVGQPLVDLGRGIFHLDDGLEGVEAEGVVHHDI